MHLLTFVTQGSSYRGQRSCHWHPLMWTCMCASIITRWLHIEQIWFFSSFLDFDRKWPLNDLWPLICVDPICTDLSGFRWPNHVTIACCLWEKKRFRANWHFWALYLGQRSHPCQSHVTGAAYVSGQFGQVSLKSVKVWRRYGHVTQVSRLTRTVRRKRNTSHAPHNEQDPSKLCLSLQWMSLQ